MEERYETFYIESNIQNGYKSHNQLCKLACELQNTTSANILIDLSKASFIAANLFPVLGAIFSNYKRKMSSESMLRVKGLTNSILDTAQKNGFSTYFGMKKIPDVNNTVIPYQQFLVDDIDEYERYLTINLFTRNDLPQMSSDASDSIRDSLLELFKNVKDHTSSESIFTCGQYFSESRMLFFTIADIGETIPYNVIKHHKQYNIQIPEYTLQWALTAGNTTSIGETPRGIGFTLIKEFVNLNNGSLYIVSKDETYEIARKKERYKKLDYPFPGTFVTVGFNLNDDAIYFLKSETNNTIQF